MARVHAQHSSASVTVESRHTIALRAPAPRPRRARGRAAVGQPRARPSRCRRCPTAALPYVGSSALRGAYGVYIHTHTHMLTARASPVTGRSRGRSTPQRQQGSLAERKRVDRDVQSPANASAGSQERSPSGRRRSQGRPATSGVRADQRVGAAGDGEVRLERLRAVAAQVLERNTARATVDRSVANEMQGLTSIEALSPVARGDTSSWATSPAESGQRLHRAGQRQGMQASMQLRRALSLWRSFARAGVASRHATAQRLLQEQLQAKTEELRVTVGALERAVAVAQEQLALAQSKSEQKIHTIGLERDSVLLRCKQLEKAAQQPFMITDDPALAQQRSALLADQRDLAAGREALEADRLKLRQLQMSLVDFSERKQLEHLPLEDALERTRRARIEDSRSDRENKLRYRDRLVSNLFSRVTWSQRSRQLGSCVTAWRDEVATAQRTRMSGQRVVTLLQRATKRRAMTSWIAMVQKSRRIALDRADSELAAALADLTAIRSSAQYTAAQQEADELRRQAHQAIEEAEAAKRWQTTAQQELTTCRAQMLAASTQHLAERDARRNAMAKRAMVALQTRTARAAFNSWADTAHKVKTTRRLVARAQFRMMKALLTRSFHKWVERCRPSVVSLAQAAEAQDASDIASFARAANHAAAETTIQLLEQQLRTGAETTVAAERKSEHTISGLEAELAAAREAIATESHRLEQSAQELLLAKAALADATNHHEETQEQTAASIALVTQHRSAARKQVSKLQKEQQGLKLALKLAQTSRLKLKDTHVAQMTRRSVARAGLRLLRVVFRRWLQECWRAQLVRSEQLFSQLSLLAEAQSAAVGLLEDEANSALLTSVTATTETTKAMQAANRKWETQKIGWSKRCIRTRIDAQEALALHCVFGAWKFFWQVKVARRAKKQSWLEHDSASSARIQSLELELEGARAKIEGLRVLGMDVGELRSDELMVLLVEAAEELAVANEAARSEAVRNDKLLKQLKADTDRQLRKLSTPAQSQMGSPPLTRLVQMNTQPSSAASVGGSVSPGALWPYRRQTLSPQTVEALPSVESSIDVADKPGQTSSMDQLLPPSPPVSLRPPAAASLVQKGESLAPAGADSVASGGTTAAEAPHTVTQQATLSPHQPEHEQKKHDAPLLAEAVPPCHGTDTIVI